MGAFPVSTLVSPSQTGNCVGNKNQTFCIFIAFVKNQEKFFHHILIVKYLVAPVLVFDTVVDNYE